MNVTQTLTALAEHPNAPIRLDGPAPTGTYLTDKAPTPHRIGESRYVYLHTGTPTPATDVATALADSLHHFTWMTDDTANPDHVTVWVNLPNRDRVARWHLASLNYAEGEYVAHLADW